MEPSQACTLSWLYVHEKIYLSKVRPGDIQLTSKFRDNGQWAGLSDSRVSFGGGVLPPLEISGSHFFFQKVIGRNGYRTETQHKEYTA